MDMGITGRTYKLNGQRQIRLYAVVIVLVWMILCAFSLWWNLLLIRQQTHNMAISSARKHLDKDLGFRLWAASHGGIYVPTDERTPPNKYLKDIPDRDITMESGKRLTLMNPAYVIRQLTREYQDNYGIQARLTGLRVINPDNSPDPWERRQLETFTRRDEEFYEIVEISGQPNCRMMRAIQIEKGCLKCHVGQGYKVGEIGGALGVILPLAPFEQASDVLRNGVKLVHLFFWIFGSIAIAWAAIRFLRREKSRLSAQAQLLTSERKFRDLVQCMPVMLIAFDCVGNIVAWTQECERVTGYKAEEIINNHKALERLYPDPDYRDEMMVNWTARGDDFYDQEWHLTCKDGRRKMISWSNISGRAPVPGWKSWAVGVDVTERHQIQERLQTFSDAFYGALDGMMFLDLEGRIQYCNQASTSFFEGASDALIGEDFAGLGESRIYMKEVLEAARTGKNGWQGEIRYETSGSIRGLHLFLSLTKVLRRDGQPAGLLAILRDTTKQRETQRQLVKSRNLLADVQAMAHLGSWEIDHKSDTLVWSEQAYDIFGLLPDEFTALYQDFMNCVHPDDRERVDLEFQNTLKNGDMFDLIHRIIRPGDGELRFVHEKCKHIMGLDGKAVRSVGMVHDITDLWQAQEDRELLEAAIEQSPECIMITDATGIIQYVNPSFERITGYTREEMIGEDAGMLTSEKQDRAILREMWEDLQDGKVWSGHFINRKKNGDPYEEDATIAPVFDRAGTIKHYVAVKRDVTEQLEMEQRLKQSQRIEAIGTLAGGIAHDFNNILGVILGYTDLAYSKIPRDSKTSKHLSNVMDAAHRAKDLVMQILTFSRKSDQELRPVQLDLLVKDAVRLLRATIPASIEIKTRTKSGIGAVRGDATQLHQVVMNLCTNAYHAMREKGGCLTITVTTETVIAKKGRLSLGTLEPGEYVRLSVEDIGCGMNAEILEHIFEPYFTTKGKGEGTGLGLAMVHGIVRQHGGDVLVQSKRGGGTMFDVYLPVSVVKERVPSVNGELDDLPRGNEKILVVDDEETIVDIAKEMLGDLGYQVAGFTSSTSAAAELRERITEYDLMISDMTMPQMTGEELIQQALSLRPDFPTILCTGFSETMDEAKAKAMGIREFMLKPLTQRDLAISVRAVLDRSMADE